MKCKRTVCDEEGEFVHSMTGDKYCLDCALKINHNNPEYPMLIRVENQDDITRYSNYLHWVASNGGYSAKLSFEDWLDRDPK